jgi:hypothetical protein
MWLADDKSLPGKVGLVALIALTLFVSTVRPLTRPSGRLNLPQGLTRLSLLSEPASSEDIPLPVPATVDLHLLAPSLVGVLLLVLKTRRAAFRSVPIHRLRLRPRRTTASLLSD